MTPETAAQLRAAFPAEVVGKLPKTTCRDCSSSPSKACAKHDKKKCGECGNYMTTAHVHLDYVGHAAVTDRLLRVDPAWDWQPLAVTDDGLPLVKDGELWIRLTVAGTARLGVGDADGKKGASAKKEMIGDAIRNAAMRFGVGLDLWSKEDLHAAAPEPVADEPVIAGLVARMNALPDSSRKRCKAMFVDAFGAPPELRAAMVPMASDLIGNFEAPDDPQGPGEDSRPDDGGTSGGRGLVRDQEHAPEGDDSGEGFDGPSDPVPSPDGVDAVTGEVASTVPPHPFDGFDLTAETPPRSLSSAQKAMHVLAGQVWPDLNRDGREERRHALIGIVTGNRTTSSHDLDADELQVVNKTLEAIADGTKELFLSGGGGYAVRPGKKKGRAA